MTRRPVFSIGDPGRAALELGAGRPPSQVEPPDHVASEHSVDGLEIRAASVRGLMHRYRDEPRQDAFGVIHEPETGTTVVVVCDGVGSKPLSHLAAEFVCLRLPEYYLAHRDWAGAVKQVNGELREYADAVHEELTLHAGEESEPPATGMATTVVALAVTGPAGARRLDLAWSDDSTVWGLAPDGAWQLLASPPDEDGDVHTGSVRALPADSPRLLQDTVSFASGAVFAMTDGVGVPLAGSEEVRAALTSWWEQPPSALEFAAQVGFARRTHIDDRTVVGIWLAEQGPGAGG